MSISSDVENRIGSNDHEARASVVTSGNDGWRGARGRKTSKRHFSFFFFFFFFFFFYLVKKVVPYVETEKPSIEVCTSTYLRKNSRKKQGPSGSELVKNVCILDRRENDTDKKNGVTEKRDRLIVLTNNTAILIA